MVRSYRTCEARGDYFTNYRHHERSFSSLPYHHLIQEHVPLLSEEEALSFGPCQWIRFTISWPTVTGTVSCQTASTITLAIIFANTTAATSLPMVCTYSPIWTVGITISSTSSCPFHDCHCRRRIVSLWRQNKRSYTQ